MRKTNPVNAGADILAEKLWGKGFRLVGQQDGYVLFQNETHHRQTADPTTWAALLSAEAERKRLKQWVADLQSGMYVNCVYCGHRYGPSAETPVAMADVLKAHIAECPEHPLSRAVALLREAAHWLIYEDEAGLAHETAKQIEEFIGRMLTRPRYRDRAQTTDVPIEDGIPSQAE